MIFILFKLPLVSSSLKLNSLVENTWFVSSLVVTVLFDAVGASFTPNTVMVITPISVAVPSETV